MRKKKLKRCKVKNVISDKPRKEEIDKMKNVANKEKKCM